MRLKTILAYQRCFDMLREADCSGTPLSTGVYIDALRASGKFDAELAEHMKPINVEIENEVRTQDHPAI